MPGLKKLGLTNPLFTGRLRQVIRFVKFGNGLFAERAKAGTNTGRRDFSHYLLTAKDPDTGEGMKSEELAEQSRGFLIAGKKFIVLKTSPEACQIFEIEDGCEISTCVDTLCRR